MTPTQTEIFPNRKNRIFGNWKPFPVPQDISSSGIYMGTCGFSFPDWNRIFYPPRVTGKRMALLSKEEQREQDDFVFYQNYFPFIEIDRTWHSPPTQTFFTELERETAGYLHLMEATA